MALGIEVNIVDATNILLLLDATNMDIFEVLVQIICKYLHT